MRFNAARLLLIFWGCVVLLSAVLTITRHAEPQPPYILFLSDATGESALYRMTRDGQNVHRLTQPNHKVFDYALSPDGREVVLVGNLLYGRSLYKIGIHGGAITSLTNNPNEDYQPNWSPDGEWVYFLSFGYGDNIQRVRPDGTQRETLNTDFRSIDRLQLSPDGSTLAFAGRIQDIFHLYQMDIGEWVPRRLLTSDAMQHFWGWSADGQRLLATQIDAGQTDMLIVNARTHEIDRVFTLPNPLTTQWTATPTTFLIRHTALRAPDYVEVDVVTGLQRDLPHLPATATDLSAWQNQWVFAALQGDPLTDVCWMATPADPPTCITRPDSRELRPQWMPPVDVPWRGLPLLMLSAISLLMVLLAMRFRFGHHPQNRLP